MGKHKMSWYAGERERGDGGATATSANVAYSIGFDDEVKLPWRRRGDDGHVELGLPLVRSSTLGDDDLAVGEWPDGFTTQIPGLRQKDIGVQSRKRHVVGELFSMEHSVTHNAIGIKQKVDRRLLMCVTEQGKQILMVKMCLWGNIENENHVVASSHPAAVGALHSLFFLRNTAEAKLKSMSCRASKTECCPRQAFHSHCPGNDQRRHSQRSRQAALATQAVLYARNLQHRWQHRPV